MVSFEKGGIERKHRVSCGCRPLGLGSHTSQLEFNETQDTTMKPIPNGAKANVLPSPFYMVVNRQKLNKNLMKTLMKNGRGFERNARRHATAVARSTQSIKQHVIHATRDLHE